MGCRTNCTRKMLGTHLEKAGRYIVVVRLPFQLGGRTRSPSLTCSVWGVPSRRYLDIYLCRLFETAKKTIVRRPPTCLMTSSISLCHSRRTRRERRAPQAQKYLQCRDGMEQGDADTLATESPSGASEDSTGAPSRASALANFEANRVRGSYIYSSTGYCIRTGFCTLKV